MRSRARFSAVRALLWPNEAMTLVSLRVVARAAIALAACPSVAAASPTMIRLGYSDCAVCHVSPQGGGLLTAYGKGIDAAQSLRPREIEAADTDTRRFRIDMRFLAASSRTNGRRAAGTSTSTGVRLMLRSSIKLGDRHRLSATAGVESPALLTSPQAQASADTAIAIPKAVWEYTPRAGVAITAGRDELPSGIGLPEVLSFIRRGHDPGQTPYPTQIKASFAARRLQLTPYVFGPGGDEDVASREYGAGIVGGIELWRQRAIVGLTARTGRATAYGRQSVGAYARVGFGKWGVLAEHDLTSRSVRLDRGPASTYLAGHTQVFVAPYEWLVTSIAAEHVVVSGAVPSHLYQVAPAMQVRVSPNLTAIFSTRETFTRANSTRSRTYAIHVAVKATS